MADVSIYNNIVFIINLTLLVFIELAWREYGLKKERDNFIWIILFHDRFGIFDCWQEQYF